MSILFQLFVFCSLTYFTVFSIEVATNNWYVQFKDPIDINSARNIVKKNGFSVLNKVLGSDKEYHVVHKGLEHARSKRSISHTRALKRIPLMPWTIQWTAMDNSVDCHGQFGGLCYDCQIERAEQLTGFTRTKRGYKSFESARKVKRDVDHSVVPSDPLYEKEWYLKNTGQAGGSPGLDLNVEAAWKLGYTGRNITTAIMDDGIDYLHPDLYNNFNAEASFDFSSNDAFPYPRFTDDWFNSHGTRCAGEIAAAKDGNGAVGVAYNSKIAGLRMLDQPYMTDMIEAQSMGYRQDLIDIYSASWGPTDDGKTCDGPRKLTMRAIVQGVNKGRNGKGNIYVWASGDGGPDDDCNCDGYATSMWTVSINSVTNDGETALYDESCSSTLASTFSNGKPGYSDVGVATTDLFGNVTTKHSGTSAAAPEAAGVFSLALEANPDLTWRDIQHLTVLTSKRNHLHDSTEQHPWKLNGAGLEFNHLFGFGVMDAGAMVKLARVWKTAPERFHCEAKPVSINREFDGNNKVTVKVDSSGCEGQDNEVNYLEHVQAFITVNATRRGDIEMFLTSPSGTKSMILSRRPNDDDSNEGFVKWPFMTTHSWAEGPKGLWVLEVGLDNRGVGGTGFLSEFSLVLHGTKVSPYTSQSGTTDNGKLQLAKKLHQQRKQ